MSASLTPVVVAQAATKALSEEGTAEETELPPFLKSAELFDLGGEPYLSSTCNIPFAH